MFSEKFNVYRSGWLDLVFANRNQEYGAYELRRSYAGTLNKALLLASAVFISVVTFPVVYHHFHQGKPDEAPVVFNSTDDKVVVLDLAKVQPPPPAPAPAAEPVKVKTTRFVPPRVVKADEVKEDMPEVALLERSTISTRTQEGSESPYEVSPAEVSTTGSGTGTGTAEGSNEVVGIDFVEQFPQFPGGMEAFAKYLRKNLRYPAAAVENGISGRVFLSFIVERDGRLTDIKVIRGIGYGCDEEAVRVLKKSPAWSPGIQNKQKVRVQYTLPLLFQME